MKSNKIILGIILVSLLSSCSLSSNSSSGSSKLSTDNSSSTDSGSGSSSTSSDNGGNGGTSTTPQSQKLSIVTDISYDATSKILSWSAVDHANEYNVDVNGTTQQVDTNSMNFVPVEETSRIKVQACDTTDKYITSDWSDTYVYTMQKEDKLTLVELNTFVNGMMPGYKLKSLTSMYISSANSKYYKGVLHTQGVFSVDGVDKVVGMSTLYSEKINSLSDAMIQESISDAIDDEYTVANYNSAQYLLDSNSYAGKMEEYRQNGWDFSVVSSSVGYKSKNSFRIFATYKLARGNETKYIQSELACGIKNKSTSTEINYTTKLLNSSDRDIEELSCNEYTEENGLLEVGKLLDGANTGQVASYNPSSNTITYGLYPQSHVSDSSTIAALNNLTAESNGWYLYNDEYYAKKTLYTFVNGTTIVSETTYWFKCEPIEWEIRYPLNGKYSLVSTKLLDAHRYDDDSNSYANSEIRSWLNGDFLNTAFSLDSSLIQTTLVDNSASTTNSSSNSYACENTNDKIYLLSYKDYSNATYSTRMCKPTDYALASNCYQNNGNGRYWTRSPYSGGSDYAWIVNHDGNLSDYHGNYVYDVSDSDFGVRPALTIKL